MAVTPTTPQSAKGWRSFTRALGVRLPGQLGEVRRSGRRMVAATAPAKQRKA